MTELNIELESIHAQRILRDNNGKLRKTERWKSINKIVSHCEYEEWIENSKHGTQRRQKCRKEATVIVSHEVSRFYGFKHLESAYCEKHGRIEFWQLKKLEAEDQITRLIEQPERPFITHIDISKIETRKI